MKFLLLLLLPLFASAQDCPPGQIRVNNGTHWKCESSVPLPVELIEFRAFEASVTWVTATEVDVARFEIESSSDAKTWVYQAEILPKGPSRYTIAIRPALYYRLRVIDRDETQYVYLIDNRTLRREGTYNERSYDTIGRQVK